MICLIGTIGFCHVPGVAFMIQLTMIRATSLAYVPMASIWCPSLSCCAGWQNGFLEADWSFARDAYSTCIYSTGCTFPKFPKFEHYGFAFGYGDDPNVLIGNLFVHERFWPTAYSFVYCGSWDIAFKTVPALLGASSWMILVSSFPRSPNLPIEGALLIEFL